MSIEFIFRIIGMVVLAIGGAWFGVYFSSLSGEDPVAQSSCLWNGRLQWQV